MDLYLFFFTANESPWPPLSNAVAESKIRPQTNELQPLEVSAPLKIALFGLFLGGGFVTGHYNAGQANLGRRGEWGRDIPSRHLSYSAFNVLRFLVHINNCDVLP